MSGAPPTERARPVPDTHRRARRRLLVLLAACAAALLPWIAFLLVHLPDRHASQQWKIAWVGFDVALFGCFVASVWLGWRRRRSVAAVLVATATLLLCDAWFDITLTWADPNWWATVVIALDVEVPLALLLVRTARSIAAAYR